MAAKFKAGDAVELIVGGPPMVIDSESTTGRYMCVWFAGKKREHALFSEASLKPYVEQSKDND